MNPFEYALGLFVILIGLALADIGTSLHRLARNIRTVRWDARVVVTVALVLVETVRLWFAQWSLRDVTFALQFSFYIVLFAQNLLLFLLAAACLPDRPENDCDLGRFYDANRRYFWSLYAGYHATYCALYLWIGGSISTAGASSPFDWFRVVAPLPLYLLLAWRRERWLHLVVPVAIALFYIAIYWRQSLG